MLNFFKKNRIMILLFSIVVFGAFLRLYNFNELVRFNDDQSRDAQIVNNMFEKREFPLLGPKAGGTKFNLGPAYYYLEYFSALVFGNNPSGIAVITVILSIVSIALLFVFLKFYFSANISLFIAFLYAISFFAVKYSKFSWNPNVIPFFLLLFFISLYKISLKKETNDGKLYWYLLLGLTFGIGVQLHTLLLITMPILLFLELIRSFAKKNKQKAKRLLFVALIGVLLNSPLLIYDIQNNGENIQSFFQGTDKKVTDNFSLTAMFMFYPDMNRKKIGLIPRIICPAKTQRK